MLGQTYSYLCSCRAPSLALGVLAVSSNDGGGVEAMYQWSSGFDDPVMHSKHRKLYSAGSWDSSAMYHCKLTVLTIETGGRVCATVPRTGTFLRQLRKHHDVCSWWDQAFCHVIAAATAATAAACHGTKSSQCWTIVCSSITSFHINPVETRCQLTWVPRII